MFLVELTKNGMSVRRLSPHHNPITIETVLETVPVKEMKIKGSPKAVM